MPDDKNHDDDGPSFEDHDHVLTILSESQEADFDNREAAREAHIFVDKEDGQWEPQWWEANSDNPRYTFDMTSPIVDHVAGTMEKQDFNISVRPAGGDVTKDDAALRDGLIRNIENISGATKIYNAAGRNMITGGLDGWMVAQDYVNDDSFDQDLIIRRIANFIDSVWFGPYTEPDASDAPWVVVLEAISKREYDRKYPEGSGASVGDGRSSTAYYYKAEQVVIANIFYFEETEEELLLMSSGQVLEAKEAQPVLDELEMLGVSVEDRRMRKKKKVKSRLFDGSDWLNEPQDTVFSYLPVVPTHGNFKVFENKVLYRGVVAKLMDPQRVFNYSKSREVEENALSPRGKYWMTKKQAAGHSKQLATLNTNSEPVQFYTPDPMVPGPPQRQPGGEVNPGLAVLSNDMQGVMERTAGRFAASMGDNPNMQSGVAIKRLQDKGDVGDIKYVEAQEIAICHTAKILIDAIPKLYTGQRQQRILKEDGSFDMTVVNQVVRDEQTGQPITVNDLSKGKYDVVCSAGPGFQNRQQETVSAITEIAMIDPTAIEIGSDILFNNLSSPGMDLLAERKRQQLFLAGVIPEAQMTDEEKAQLQAMQQQPKEPDPAEILAQAEVGKAQAEINKAEAQADAVRVTAATAQRKEDRLDALAVAKIEADEEQFDFKQLVEIQKQQAAAQAAIIKEQKDLAATLESIRNAMGAESVVGPPIVEAFINTAEQLNDLTSGN